MRGLISLAVIFFVALSAQASARTYIECVGERFAVHRGNEIPREMRSNERFLFSFDADNGSRFENPKIEGTDCTPSTTSKGGAFFSEPDSISIYCKQIGDVWFYKIQIDRISGKFLKRVAFRGANDGFELTEGRCKKVKPKF